MDDDIQSILQAQKQANATDLFQEFQYSTKKAQSREAKELDEFEKTLFGNIIDDDETKVSSKTTAESTLKSVSKLKAKRQKRIKEKLQAERIKLQRLEVIFMF